MLLNARRLPAVFIRRYHEVESPLITHFYLYRANLEVCDKFRPHIHMSWVDFDNLIRISTISSIGTKSGVTSMNTCTKHHSLSTLTILTFPTWNDVWTRPAISQNASIHASPYLPHFRETFYSRKLSIPSNLKIKATAILSILSHFIYIVLPSTKRWYTFTAVILPNSINVNAHSDT